MIPAQLLQSFVRELSRAEVMAIHGLWVSDSWMAREAHIDYAQPGHKQSWRSCLSTKLRRWMPFYDLTFSDKLNSFFSEGLPGLTSNEYLVLAGTLHGIHAITARLSPTGASSGAQVIEGETFKMTIMLTATGMFTRKQVNVLFFLLTLEQVQNLCYSRLSRRRLRTWSCRKFMRCTQMQS